MDNIALYHGDCLELMRFIPDGSVDMVLADLPYGTTHCAWDKRIPFEPLWEQYRRVCKENAAIVLFSIQPFTTGLINSNRKMFRYEWIYQKTRACGFLNANRMPLRAHENILVFYRGLPCYHPQKRAGNAYAVTRANTEQTEIYRGHREPGVKKYDGARYPTDVLRFPAERGLNPTQKPVPLLEYLIRTYTDEGEVVLDNTMGSGSTGVACVNTGRRFIGMELDEEIYRMAAERIRNAECGIREET